MKRLIKSDWDYDSIDEVNALKDLMSENIDREIHGEVGIFWYDPETDDLFGVRSADVDDVQFYKSEYFNARVKTCRPMHYQVWEKEYHRHKDKRFFGDYTRVPRGRVFYIEDRGFIVVTGSWIEDYPSAKQCILDEFDLPASTEFIEDSHWDLGHGWSDRFM